MHRKSIFASLGWSLGLWLVTLFPSHTSSPRRLGQPGATSLPYFVTSATDYTVPTLRLHPDEEKTVKHNSSCPIIIFLITSLRTLHHASPTLIFLLVSLAGFSMLLTFFHISIITPSHQHHTHSLWSPRKQVIRTIDRSKTRQMPSP